MAAKIFFSAASIAGLTAFGNGYQALLRFFLRHKLTTVALFVAGLGLTYWVYERVPRGFIPAEDAGYFIIAVQSPEGASLEYTTNICKQAEVAIQPMEEVTGVFSVAGFSFGGGAPNRALVFVTLKPFARARRR